MSKAIATTAGRVSLARARAGIAALPKCAYIALGSGGIHTDGTLKIPAENASGLYDEIIRKEIVNPPGFPLPTTATYQIKLETEECADIIFSEIGLFDETDTLIAIKTFNPKQKDGDMEMLFEIDDIF